MRAKQILLLSLFAITAVSAFGQEKQKPPQGGTHKPFTLPAAQTFALKNGAKVTMVPYGSVPKVTIRVVVDTGNINEGPNQIWLADITGRLLKEGTKTRSSEQIAQQAAGMGGSVTVG